MTLLVFAVVATWLRNQPTDKGLCAVDESESERAANPAQSRNASLNWGAVYRSGHFTGSFSITTLNNYT